MDNSMLIIAIFLGIIQIVLIFAVIQTAQNTKEANNYLKHINIKLNDIHNAVTGNGTTEEKTDTSWICTCGNENNDADFCVKCGARKP